MAVAGEPSEVLVERVPRSVEFVSSLPRTPTGKLLKHKLIDGVTGAGAASRPPGSPSLGR